MIKTNKHFGYYFYLITILVIGLLVTWRLSPNEQYQMISLVIISIIYAGSGIIHHLLNHDLVDKIVIEYVLVALLGIAAAFFIFRGGFGF